MKILDMLIGAALVSAAISAYYTLQAEVIIFGLTLFLSGTITGIYIAQLLAKSDRTSFGEEPQ